MSSATLQREGVILRLGGAVNSITAADLYRDLKTAFRELAHSADKGQPVTLDCSGIESCDSSAVALLLAARRMAAEQGQSLAVAGLDGQVGSLAHLYGVDELLDIPEVI